MSMKNFLLLAAFAIVFGSIRGQTPITLQQIQAAATVEGQKGGQVPLSRDSDGKMRYAQYVEIEPTPVPFTPTATGNATHLSEFVIGADNNDYFIDWQGRGRRLNVTADMDWLKISNNQIPYAITDTIWTDNLVSINGRGIVANCELTVFDSVSVAGVTIAAVGNREARLAMFNTLNGAWSTIEQNGSAVQIGAATGTTAFKVVEIGSGTPGAPAGPFTNHFSVDFSSDVVKMDDYASPRNDAGSPLNIASFDAAGIMRRHGVYELKDSLIAAGIGGSSAADSLFRNHNGGYWGTETAKAYRTGKLALSPVFSAADTIGRLNISQAENISTPSIHFGGNQQEIFTVPRDSRATTPAIVDFGFGRSWGPAASSAGDNQVFTFGMNASVGGLRKNNAKSAMWIAMENNYKNSPSDAASYEFHCPQVTYPTASARRPISMFLSNDEADLRGNISFATDNFSITDYKTLAQKITWGFVTNGQYPKGITFADTASIYFAKNNTGGLWQRNVANTSYLQLMKLNAADELELMINTTSVAQFLKMNSSAVIYGTGGVLSLGNATFPSRVDMRAGGTDIANFINSSGEKWLSQVNPDFCLRRESGAFPIVLRLRNGSLSNSIVTTSSGVGIGVLSPGAWLHAKSPSSETTAVFQAENTTGSNKLFRHFTNPNSVISATIGDFCLTPVGTWESAGGSVWNKYQTIISGTTAARPAANTLPAGSEYWNTDLGERQIAEPVSNVWFSQPGTKLISTAANITLQPGIGTGHLPNGGTLLLTNLTGAITITLKQAGASAYKAGDKIYIKATTGISGTNTVTIDPEGATQIEVGAGYATTRVLTIPFTYLTLVFNGTEWNIISG